MSLLHRSESPGTPRRRSSAFTGAPTSASGGPKQTSAFMGSLDRPRANSRYQLMQVGAVIGRIFFFLGGGNVLCMCDSGASFLCVHKSIIVSPHIMAAPLRDYVT